MSATQKPKPVTFTYMLGYFVVGCLHIALVTMYIMCGAKCVICYQTARYRC